PRRDQLISSEKRSENITSARVLTDEAREELWNQKPRVEAAAKPKMFQAEAKAASGASNGIAATNGHKNGKYNRFDDLDDEINLEIGEAGGFY
ncbi:MAG TPA: hypothetical protein VF721_07065, partial [Pyrinomonadaceae bacterium]